MFGRILAFLLVVPVVELLLLLQVGEWLGFWPTIALILATALAGAVLLKREGLAVWGRFNARFRQGQLPGDELLDGLIVLVCGALLITPGVLTDLAGLAGLIPATRAPLRRQLQRFLKGRVRVGVAGFPGAAPEPSGWQGAPAEQPRHQRTPPDAS